MHNFYRKNSIWFYNKEFAWILFYKQHVMQKNTVESIIFLGISILRTFDEKIAFRLA